jgi:hypothetical protein
LRGEQRWQQEDQEREIESDETWILHDGKVRSHCLPIDRVFKADYGPSVIHRILALDICRIAWFRSNVDGPPEIIAVLYVE